MVVVQGVACHLYGRRYLNMRSHVWSDDKARRKVAAPKIRHECSANVGLPITTTLSRRKYPRLLVKMSRVI